MRTPPLVMFARLPFLLIFSLLTFALSSAPAGVTIAITTTAIPPKPPLPVQHDPKIESSLEIVAAALQAAGAAAMMSHQLQPIRAVVELNAPLVPAALPAGVTLEAQTERPEGLARVAISGPAGLRELARLPQVRFIRRPYRAIPAEPQETQRGEALGPIGALLFYTQGFKGQGVRVAVIDVGFGGLSWAIRNNALPKSSLADATDYTGEGLETGTNHGTAVAELVHQVAPGALLYLKKVGDEVDLANAVNDAIRQKIKIIVHSVGWVNTNFNDGTGVIDEIAARAARAGILWVNAAGNHARQHWQGPFRDENGNNWLEFAPGLEGLKIRATFGQIDLYLTWNDWPRSCQDYDLFLVDAQGNIVASSQNYQTCSEPPTEEIEYLVEKPGVYYVRVLARNRIRPVALQLFSFGQELEPFVPQGSILAPADSPEVLAVGAIPLGRWTTGPQEPFSSQGPTSDGRTKPDLCGPDNVWTFTPIGFLHRFRGTSAAAPQVAGAAALLLSAHPGWTNAQVWHILEAQAIDMGPPGKDDIYGAGRLNLNLGPPTAVRVIKTDIRPSYKVVAGESFAVKLKLRMPPFTFGGLVLQERVPQGFRLIPEEGAGARVSVTGATGSTIWTWEWPLAVPGAGKTINYRIVVDQEQPTGLYRLVGRLNGRPVIGDDAVEVIPPLTVLEAVAHWDPERRLIDLELPATITAAELQQAIVWWQQGASVPGTAGQIIDSAALERLVAYRLSGLPGERPLPALPAPPGTVEATRELRTSGAEISVTLMITAQATIYGLRVAERWPRGVNLQPLALPAGTVFKSATGEFFIPRVLKPGERLRISYRVSVPANTIIKDLKVTGTASSALPRFAVKIGGASEIELAPAELGRARELVLERVWTQNTGNAVLFSVSGRNIIGLQVLLYDLAGREIASGAALGNTLALPLSLASGRPLACGVYLYLLVIRGPDGRVIRKLGKLAVLRPR